MFLLLNYIANTNPLQQFQENLHDAAIGFREGREKKRKRERMAELLQSFPPDQQAKLAGFEDPEEFSKAILHAEAMKDLAGYRHTLGLEDISYKTDEDIRKEKAKNRDPFEKFTLENEGVPMSTLERKQQIQKEDYSTKKAVDVGAAKDLKNFSTDQDIKKEKAVAPIKYKYQKKLKETIPGKNTTPMRTPGTVDFMGALDSSLNELMKY